MSNLNNYLDAVNMPQNPYQSSTNVGTKEKTYGAENRQFIAETNMAQYNQQAHAAELYQQRQWALQDAEYNSPKAFRQRLEEAGYNPALMAGAVQTANQPVRASTANTPTGSISNMSGYAAAKNAQAANVIKAGENLTASLANAQLMRLQDADINLKNTQSVKTMIDAASTDQQRRFANDLFSYNKQALQSDIANKNADTLLKFRQGTELIDQQIKEIASKTAFNDASVDHIINQIANENKLTSAQVAKMKQEASEIALRIKNNPKLMEQVQADINYLTSMKGQIDNQADKIKVEETWQRLKNNILMTTTPAEKALPYIRGASEIFTIISGSEKNSRSDMQQMLNLLLLVK